MTSVSVRNAEFSDTQSIYEIIKANAGELLPRAISDIDQNIDRFIVAIAEQRVIGTVSWQILPEIGLPQNPTVEIKSLAVDSAFRKQNVGRTLVEAAVARVSKLHPSQIIALTFTPDFFKKLGFHEVPKSTLMHKIYMGCINCTKYDSPFTCPEVAMALDAERYANKCDSEAPHSG